jgi:flagellar hook-associated protein 1 FlgK
MAGLFGSLNTATRGLHAQQTALQTTSHNLANANSPGYTRQRVTMQADIAQSIPGIGQVGTGVNISGIHRVSDNYITTQLRNGQSILDLHKAKSEILGQLEAVFNEPSSSGLSNQISEVFAAWTNLGSNPEVATSKTMVVQTTETMTDIIHHMSNQMNALKQDTVQELDKAALDANSTLIQLERLNHQIWQASVRGEMPNDMLDAQDALLKDLAGTMDISVERDRFNRVSVSVDGQTILNESERKEIAAVIATSENGQPIISGNQEVTGDYTLGQFVVKEADGSVTGIELTSGFARGAQEALVVIDDMIQELNDFAYSFATAVNMIHSHDGEGMDFFTFDPNNVAGTIRVHEDILNDPTIINAGRDLDNSVAGDGTRAQAIAALQDANLPYSSENWTFNEDSLRINESTSAGASIFSRYNSMVTEMGIIKQQEDNMLSTQEALTGLLEQRRESVSGVDINEEVVDMIKYSSAFQANSRVLSVISEMLDTLINRTGV